MFLTLLGYTVAKACPRNSTWFTRSFLLVRGWGLGTRPVKNHSMNSPPVLNLTKLQVCNALTKMAPSNRSEFKLQLPLLQIDLFPSSPTCFFFISSLPLLLPLLTLPLSFPMCPVPLYLSSPPTQPASSALFPLLSSANFSPTLSPGCVQNYAV